VGADAHLARAGLGGWPVTQAELVGRGEEEGFHFFVFNPWIEFILAWNKVLAVKSRQRMCGCKQPAAEDHSWERINEYCLAIWYSFSIR
jgi:hypothetical protein